MKRYQDNINTLITNSLKIKDTFIIDFLNKYNTWNSFFESVLAEANHPTPKVHALVVTFKMIVLCGLAEAGGRGENPKEKFDNFLSYLTLEEKLGFILIFVTKPSMNSEAEEIINKDSNDDTRIEELIKLSTDRDTDFHREINEVIESFLGNDTVKLNFFFKSRVNLLYGIRSKIVHQGDPDVIGTALTSDGEILMHYGNKGNSFFTIKYPMEEFFIRALLRSHGEIPQKIDLKEFLNKNYNHINPKAVLKLIEKVKKS